MFATGQNKLSPDFFMKEFARSLPLICDGIAEQPQLKQYVTFKFRQDVAGFAAFSAASINGIRWFPFATIQSHFFPDSPNEEHFNNMMVTRCGEPHAANTNYAYDTCGVIKGLTIRGCVCLLTCSDSQLARAYRVAFDRITEKLFELVGQQRNKRADSDRMVDAVKLMVGDSGMSQRHYQAVANNLSIGTGAQLDLCLPMKQDGALMYPRHRATSGTLKRKGHCVDAPADVQRVIDAIQLDHINRGLLLDHNAVAAVRRTIVDESGRAMKKWKGPLESKMVSGVTEVIDKYKITLQNGTRMSMNGKRDAILAMMDYADCRDLEGGAESSHAKRTRLS